MRGGRVKRPTKQSLPNTKRRSFYRDCRVARRAPRNRLCTLLPFEGQRSNSTAPITTATGRSAAREHKAAPPFLSDAV
ncbi:MAG: hypothetical protein LBL66_03855 [Clostridiales bacterium]|nr:hypothetical protein [Clostridiales bacterium]